jgi:predicted O-methyltransferase YrrM
MVSLGDDGRKTDFEFTNDWFVGARPIWDQILKTLRPRRLLEIGSYEGQSACYLIETVGRMHEAELHCIDTWQGGIEHGAINMAEVERRFLKNTDIAIRQAANSTTLNVHKARSDFALAQLFVQGYEGFFDFIYIDGSHQAPDVLTDAVLSFRLLRKGGLIAFDDYLWSENLPGGPDILRMPKSAIDAFINLHIRQLRVVMAPLYQLYIEKL